MGILQRLGQQSSRPKQDINQSYTYIILLSMLLISSILIAGLSWRQRSELIDNATLYEYHLQSARLAEEIAIEADVITNLPEHLTGFGDLASPGYNPITSVQDFTKVQDAIHTINQIDEDLRAISVPDNSDDLFGMSVKLDNAVTQLRTAIQPESAPLDQQTASILELAQLTNLRARQLARTHNLRFETKAAQMQSKRRRADIALVILFVITIGAGMLVIRQTLRRMMAGQLELARNESRLRAVTDNIPGIVFQAVVDDDETVETLFQSHGPMLDPTDQNVKSFPSLQALFRKVKPSRKADLTLAIQAANKNLSDFVETLEYITSDKYPTWYKVTASIDIGTDGRPVWTGLLLDVTEQKTYENELVFSKIQADEANQAKSTFLSSMSHEIRTPMNGILGLAQILRMKEESEDQLTEKDAFYVNQIIDSGNHLLSIVDDVLDLSRVESGKTSFAIEVFDSKSIIAECIATVEPEAFKTKVEIINEIEQSGGLEICADKVRFKQVLLNVLSNAVKFNKPGGTITLKHCTSAHYAQISVTDTGLGISKQNQYNLFKPFNRLGRESSNIPGTGIGLSICKRFVEEMGGRITIDSAEGEGTTVAIELPESLEGLRQSAE